MSDSRDADDRLQDWRHWLAGGFAFMDAPFASHPKDEGRARKMVFAAMRDGATIEDIKTAAQDYLKERSWIPEAIPAQIVRVERFVKSIKPTMRKKSAWLITWEHVVADIPPIEDRVIAIRDGRVSSEKIREFVEQTYTASTYSLDEKMHYSSHAKDNPCPAKYAIHPRGGYLYRKITCGDNPFISARIVKDLRLFEDANGEQVLDWAEVTLEV